MTLAEESVERHIMVRLQPLAQTLGAVLAGTVFLAVLLAPLLAHSARAGNEETVRTVGNVSYVSGGVGTESQDQLSSLAKDFNLKLVFALKSGAFVSSVKVSIVDAKGKSLLDTTSDGPWLMAKLPAGSYQVSASLAGNAVTHKIAVAAAGLKTLDFRWSSE